MSWTPPRTESGRVVWWAERVCTSPPVLSSPHFTTRAAPDPGLRARTGYPGGGGGGGAVEALGRAVAVTHAPLPEGAQTVPRDGHLESR